MRAQALNRIVKLLAFQRAVNAEFQQLGVFQVEQQVTVDTGLFHRGCIGTQSLPRRPHCRIPW